MTGDHPTELVCDCGGPIWQWYGELPDGYSETFYCKTCNRGYSREELSKAK